MTVYNFLIEVMVSSILKLNEFPQDNCIIEILKDPMLRNIISHRTFQTDAQL